MPNVLGSRRVIWSRPRVVWVWRDEFDGAAGAPSAALWTETDTDNVLAVGGAGLLNVAGRTPNTVGDPGVLSLRSFARRPGLTIESLVRNGGSGSGPYTIWLKNQTPSVAANYAHALYPRTTGVFAVNTDGTIVETPYAWAGNTWYWVRVVLRAAGALHYLSADGRAWKCVWRDDAGTDSPLWAHLHTYSAAGDIDWVRIYRGRVKQADVSDEFTRTDSALSLGTTPTGQAWTAVAGTGGIASNRGYSVTDADGDLFTIPTDDADGIVELVTRGTLNSATNYRIPALVFRYADGNNYLQAYLQNGSVYLDKIDGGVASNLGSAAQTTADNTDYTLRVIAVGNAVNVYVANTKRIGYTLAGGDTKYSAYTTVGAKLRKGGSPATAARWDSLRVDGGIP